MNSAATRIALMGIVVTSTLMASVPTAASNTSSTAINASISVKRNDYNRDAISDIVSVDINDSCLYRWNGNGNGAFNAGVRVGCTWDAYYSTVTSVGDINRDGVGDLVAINLGDDCLYRWIGNGNGGLNAGVRIGCNWGPYFFSITSGGDLNRDGIGDLVAINTGDKCLYRWTGNGSGGFTAGVRVGCGWGAYELTLTGAGDLNRDGVGDLVAVNAGDKCLYRWTGNGSGGFNAGARIGCNWGAYAFDLAGMGDINRDGVGDLVAINNGDDCLYRWTGNGNGGLNAGVRVGCGWTAYPRIN